MFGDIMKAVAGPIIGGIFGREAEEDRAHSAQQQQEQNTALQREFAQHGIRWRVEDAKAAGLHPLYAIGGSGASYSPNPVVVGSGSSAMAEMGQNVTRAALAAADPHERALKEAQLRVLNAQASKDEALASAALSQARVSSPQGTSAPIPLAVSPTIGDELDVGYWARGRIEDPAHQVDTVRFKPDDSTSVSAVHPYRTAADNKGSYSEYAFPGGFKMLLPAGSSMSEAVEALGESPMTALMVIQHNMKHYGPGWGRSFAKQFPGLSSLVETGEELAEVLAGIGSRARPDDYRYEDLIDRRWWRPEAWKGTILQRRPAARRVPKWPY